MKETLSRVLFWWRTRRAAHDLDIILERRRQGRAGRQAAARKGAGTKFQHRMEGLKR